MNGAGHIADMIARMKFNKDQRGRRKEHAKKYREVSLREVHQHDSLSNLVNRKMPESEKLKFRERLQRDDKRMQIIGILFFTALAIIMIYLFYIFFF